MNKVMVLSLITGMLFSMSCSGKDIVLKGKWDCIHKSINPDLMIKASIEENSNILTVDFYENLGLVCITIVNDKAEIVYSSRYIQTNEIVHWILPLVEYCEEGILFITDGQNEVYGEFTIK